MEWAFGKALYITLVTAAFIALWLGLAWLDDRGWTDRIGNFFWGTVCLIAALFSFREMIETIDFDKPLFLSIYWSTLGYFLLAVVLAIMGIGSFISLKNR
jgi:hypothetical protein